MAHEDDPIDPHYVHTVRQVYKAIGYRRLLRLVAMLSDEDDALRAEGAAKRRAWAAGARDPRRKEG